MLQGGMARAKVVDGDACALILDPGQQLCHAGGIVDCGGLGDLDDQALCGAARTIGAGDEGVDPLGVR